MQLGTPLKSAHLKLALAGVVLCVLAYCFCFIVFPGVYVYYWASDNLTEDSEFARTEVVREIREGDYGCAAFLLRQYKMNSEYGFGSEKVYRDTILKIREDLRSAGRLRWLPFDLEFPDRVLYGLFASEGDRCRLEGDARLEEMDRLARELAWVYDWIKENPDRPWSQNVAFYAGVPENGVTMGVLTTEEMQWIWTRVEEIRGSSEEKSDTF